MPMSGHEVYEVGNPPDFNQRTQQTAVLGHSLSSALELSFMHSPQQQELQFSDLAHKLHCRTVVSISAIEHKAKPFSSSILQAPERVLCVSSEYSLV